MNFMRFHENGARGTFKFVRQAVERNRRGRQVPQLSQPFCSFHLFGRKWCPRATNIHFSNRIWCLCEVPFLEFLWIFMNFHVFSEVFPFLEVAKVNYILMRYLNNLFPSNILMIVLKIIDIIKIFWYDVSLFCFRNRSYCWGWTNHWKPLSELSFTN